MICVKTPGARLSKITSRYAASRFNDDIADNFRIEVNICVYSRE